METVAESLLSLGNRLTVLGLAVVPFSFAMYFPMRWLEYIWRAGYSRLVKAGVLRSWNGISGRLG
jgi:hypothetical protein